MNSEYFNSVNRYRYFYNIRPGDTLSKVILKIYHHRYGSDGYRLALDQILTDNPEIQHPDKVRIGQAISLRPLNSQPASTSPVASQFAPNPAISKEDKTQFERTMKQMPQEQQDLFWALSWLEDAWGPASTGAGVTFASMGILLGGEGKGNIAKLAEIEKVYQQYKLGVLTKGQYDYHRSKILKSVAQNFGPIEKVLFKGKKAREAMRISRAGGVSSTVALRKNTQRLAALSSGAARGGTLLTAVGIGVSCHQISSSSSIAKKNEIFVETVASNLVGIAAGVAISLVVGVSSIGWFAALSIAAVSAGIGYASGKTGAHFYKKLVPDLNLVSITGVDKVCSQ
ncbi:peptidoglycan-binding protein LysM [Vibrio variabilis]|uniref:peptidoglycan-binding protein LysM n=1 Tax=Vibrio variabilis TaxID=990271 RepID=UPI000DDBE00E|nr:peptidoglycan-binding protein LysM [Vibrio variabilis]